VLSVDAVERAAADLAATALPLPISMRS